ncbi:hypothetical protein [Sporosarcina sp. SAFN-010]|uniref:hypothetical protein n=1 Tax=Sporosarcina sp. SAFN-010 TaxID=3387273 RepID=UPI003F820F87
MENILPCPDQELICINVDKVYDWVMKENTFDYFLAPSPLTFSGITSTTSLTDSVVSCEVTPAAVNPFVILRRENRSFMIDGCSVCLQQLTIQKNFNLVLYVTLANGTVLRGPTQTISRSEQVTLCAPEGTDVMVEYTDLDCIISSPGVPTLNTATQQITFTGLVITIATCQSIQSTYPVTVEFLADYCEPRADLAIGACPPPAKPAQCHAVYPD